MSISLHEPLFAIPYLRGKVSSCIRTKGLGFIDIEKTNMTLFTKFLAFGKAAKGLVAILVRFNILKIERKRKVCEKTSRILRTT